MNTALLIASFSKNSDIWKITDFFLRKYWPQLPYSIYLGANGEDRHTEVPEGWTYLNLGPDRSWAESMIDYLDNIPEENVFLLLDDFLLCGEPDKESIAAAVHLVEDRKAEYVILHAKRSPGPAVDDRFASIKRYDDSLTTLKPEIWNKAFFRTLLGLGLDPWEFERKAYLFPETRKGRFFAVRKDAFPIRHCLEKGRYQSWLADYLNDEGCTILQNPERPILTQEVLAARRKNIGRTRLAFFKLFEHGYPNYLAKKIAFTLKRRHE